MDYCKKHRIYERWCEKCFKWEYYCLTCQRWIDHDQILGFYNDISQPITYRLRRYVYKCKCGRELSTFDTKL